MSRPRRVGRVAVITGALVINPFPVTPAIASVTDCQAENATISQGVVESNHAGFTGTGFVNYDNLAGSYVEWTVDAGRPPARSAHPGAISALSRRAVRRAGQ
jgi:hypothetical protein